MYYCPLILKEIEKYVLTQETILTKMELTNSSWLKKKKSQIVLKNFHFLPWR